MKRFALPVAVVALSTACARPDIGPEPSLAPRAAEAIDPRVAIPSEVPISSVDAALASKLASLVGQAHAAGPRFNTLRQEADRLSIAAGPPTSESWIAAQQSLSRLIEQQGVTTRMAAEIDEIAATQLKNQRWIAPADREAIAAAAAEVTAINDAQSNGIAQIREQLSR